MDDIEKQILISKKIADFFSEQLKTDSDNRFALIGLAHSSMNVYTFSTRALKDENIALESKIMDYKKKAIDTFEQLTEIAPDYSLSYFHLAFFYLNLGLYKKAELSFKEFLKTVFDDKNFLSEEMKEEMIKEANQNIHRLKIPIKIEEAENDIRTGNFKKARPVIEKYIIEEEFKNHWVLYLDLGIIYNEIYMENEAIEILEEGLKLKPQSVDIINLLITIYKKLNDDEMISKYSKKLELIQRGEL